MRLEVVRQRSGVTLPKAAWQRHVAPIILQEVWNFFFAFIFQLPGWALMAPSCFEDLEASLSNYLQPLTSTLSTVARWLLIGLPGVSPNSRILAEMWLLPQKVVRLKADQLYWWLRPCQGTGGSGRPVCFVEYLGVCFRQGVQSVGLSVQLQASMHLSK